jgi:hypothetical protein
MRILLWGQKMDGSFWYNLNEFKLNSIANINNKNNIKNCVISESCYYQRTRNVCQSGKQQFLSTFSILILKKFRWFDKFSKLHLCKCKYRCQFHQHFTRDFLYESFAQNFFFVLWTLNFFVARILAQMRS